MGKAIDHFGKVLLALMLCIGFAVTGCYDDTALLEQLENHESRLKELERLTAQQNTNIQSLQTIVNALQERDYVTNVAPIKEGDDVIGYTITFGKSGSATIYNGEDGYVPAMGVKQDTDGQWYWTVDGNWMTDGNGNKVRASAVDGEDGTDGVTPQLKIVDGYWYVSYDGGNTWEDEPLGQATGDQGYTMFAEVSYDDDYLYITMADGQKITLPRTSADQGEGSVIQVGPIAMELSEITTSTVTFTGTVTELDALPYIEKIAVYYKDSSETFSVISAKSVSTTEIDSDKKVTVTISGLSYNTSYNYSIFVESRGVKTYSDVKDFTTAPPLDLSENSPANCYIVSEADAYSFKAVKGNSDESVGTIAEAEVLWESFGTDVSPSVGSLVKAVNYTDGRITFLTPETFTEGNAVIAAKDADGKILWSWHIWLTDQPQAQVYNNNAGTMMDRNLGATSATPGDVGALGLLYQWGRKDPFLGSSSIHYESKELAASTLTWPSAVESTSTTGTIAYITANPTTFVTYNSNNYDWYYSDVDDVTDDTRWQSSKTIYDPCPPGWRVPDSGSSGVWQTSGFVDTTYDSTDEGISFSISSPSTTWYPASGLRSNNAGRLSNVGYLGIYWSVTPYSYRAYDLGFNRDGFVSPSDYNYRANGFSVRCLQMTE